MLSDRGYTVLDRRQQQWPTVEQWELQWQFRRSGTDQALRALAEHRLGLMLLGQRKMPGPIDAEHRVGVFVCGQPQPKVSDVRRHAERAAAIVLASKEQSKTKKTKQTKQSNKEPFLHHLIFICLEASTTANAHGRPSKALLNFAKSYRSKAGAQCTVEVWSAQELQYAPNRHDDVPSHWRLLRCNWEPLLRRWGQNFYQSLPLMLSSDVQARWLNLVPGDVVAIERQHTKSTQDSNRGISLYFRRVIDERCAIDAIGADDSTASTVPAAPPPSNQMIEQQQHRLLQGIQSMLVA